MSSACSIEPVRTVAAVGDSAVNVKLIANSGEPGRNYSRQYALIDVAGMPVNSGTYVITLTSP